MNLRALVIFRKVDRMAYSRSSLRPSEHKRRQLTRDFMISKFICRANLSRHIMTDYKELQSAPLIKFIEKMLTHKG